MRIAVTSGSFSNNEKLIEELSKNFKDFKLNREKKKFNKNELVEFIKDRDGIILGLDNIDDDILQSCPNLKIISKYGVGLNNIDLKACKKRNIKIGWSGGINKLSVAEMVLGLMIMFSRNIYYTSNQLKKGIWNKSGGFQLTGKSIGIIGVGNIGKEVIRLLKPFRCKIYVNDIIDQTSFYEKNKLFEVSKKYIFKNTDIITIHTPLDKSTINMVDKKAINIMKNTSFLINTARGGIVDESELKTALKNRSIAGAAIDVYSNEPPIDKELLKLPNLICTPHIGGNSKEAIEAMGLSAINHLKEFFKL